MWIKQYGLERSGTNFAKALIEMTSPDTRVLATVLGSKHAPPDLEGQIALLEEGEVGIAVTDLTPPDFASIVAAYKSQEIGVLLCVRDVVTWIDAFERHSARREKRDAEVLHRERLVQLADRWIDWIYSVTDWARDCGLRSTWAVHHEVVRDPQDLIRRIVEWGASPGEVANVNYLRKAGDFHGRENVTGRPYRTRQYREVYAGQGQIRIEDVDWIRARVVSRDPRGLAAPFLWDGRPLRRRSASK